MLIHYPRTNDQEAAKAPIPAKSSQREFTVSLLIRVNDPSAGSPTETLLRLLLPLSDKVH